MREKSQAPQKFDFSNWAQAGIGVVSPGVGSLRKRLRAGQSAHRFHM